MRLARTPGKKKRPHGPSAQQGPKPKRSRRAADLPCATCAGEGLYLAVQALWGMPQTLAGLAVLAQHARQPHFRFHGAIVTAWKSRKALSLGPFIFMPGAPGARPPQGIDRPLLVHEYGHTIQSLILGPAYLPLIGLPSVVWLNTPALASWRRRSNVSYYTFFTERSANWLGERALGEPSVGLAHID